MAPANARLSSLLAAVLPLAAAAPRPVRADNPLARITRLLSDPFDKKESQDTPAQGRSGASGGSAAARRSDSDPAQRAKLSSAKDGVPAPAATGEPGQAGSGNAAHALGGMVVAAAGVVVLALTAGAALAGGSAIAPVIGVVMIVGGAWYAAKNGLPLVNRALSPLNPAAKGR